VKYHESFVEGDQLYIVMELAEGVSLQDWMATFRERGAHIPEKDIWELLIAVMLALDYVHNTHRIIHRDLTPSNIVLGYGRDMLSKAKITDFGLARELSSTMSVAASMVGTVPYMCPEIIENKAYSGKADVWSLGCILYHLMAGAPPFEGGNPLAVASRIVECQYTPIGETEHGRGYSEELRSTCARMMAQSPVDRPSTGELVASISAHVLRSLHASRRREQRTEGELEHERQQRRQAASLFARKREEMRRMLGVVGDDQVGKGRGRDGGTGGRARVGPGDRRDDRGSDRVAMGGEVMGEEDGDGVALEQSSEPGGNGVSYGELAPHGGGVGAPEGEKESRERQLEMGPTLGRSGRVQVAGRTLTITSDRLRPIHDPLSQVLGTLHKLEYVTHMPPGKKRDWRRSCLERFRRHLFSFAQHGGTIKAHLVRLTSGSQEMVDLDFGWEVAAGRGEKRDPGRQYTMTYEGLLALLNEVAREAGFGHHVARAARHASFKLTDGDE